MSGGVAAVAIVAQPGPFAQAPMPISDAIRPVSRSAETHGVGPRITQPILVVESDTAAATALVEQLGSDGYQTEVAKTTEHARTHAMRRPPKLVVLGDLGASRASLELLEEIRGTARRGRALWALRLPVIVIGTSMSELDMLRAFEAGADDFVAPPARYLELRARVRALLRRTEPTAAVSAERLSVGPLQIDIHAHAVSIDGLPVELRRLEFELLMHLAGDPERVFAKHELLRAVWGYRSTGSTRTVDSHASRLRRKLEKHGGRWVINVWGIGYRLR